MWTRAEAFLRRLRARPRSVVDVAHWALEKYVLQRRIVERSILGHPMLLDLRNPGISRALAFYGSREPSHTRWIGENVHPGQVVLDVGANIGYYALQEARLVGEHGRVYAVEPDPRNIDVLRKNLARNHVESWVDVHALALSDTVGEVQLSLGRATNLTRLGGVPGPMDAGPTQTVTAITGDQLLKDQRKPDLIRMDVEGGEVQVLTGLRETLRTAHSKCRILLELHQHTYGPTNDFEAVLRELISFGFELELVFGSDGEDLADLGLEPAWSIRELAGVEHVYAGVPQDVAIRLSCDLPARARYLLLCRK